MPAGRTRKNWEASGSRRSLSLVEGTSPGAPLMAERQLRSLVHHLRQAIARQNTDGLTDAQLLDHFVQRHDEAAFEVLVWRHGPMVLNVCQRVLRDAQEAEDAFQATFLV